MERVGATQPEEEEALGRPYSSLPVPKVTYKKAGEGLVTRACSDKTRGNGFELKECMFILDIKKKYFIMRVARQTAQRICGCPIPASVQGQIRWALSNLV